MIINEVFKFITTPIRLVGKAITRVFRRSKIGSATKNSKGLGSATRATAKTGGSSVAKSLSPEDLFKDEYREERPTGLEAFMFRQLPRPRLTERTAADLTLEQAREYSREASRFYDYDFSLFAGGDFFYEEIEEEFLTNAIGANQNSVDRRFVDVMTMFRRTLNENTRRLLFYWTPLIFAASLILGIHTARADIGAQWLGGFGWALKTQMIAQDVGAILSALGVGYLLITLLISWPYKVVQQRNLMNLDNYITSKFARINNNFQVAKRRALNVERDKRMTQREELKEEAGVWTVAYQWFGMRLFLCELMIRNKFYQIRRNTSLYWAGGVMMVLALLGGSLFIEQSSGAGKSTLIALAAGGGIVIALAANMLRGIAPMMFGIIQANEWSRFNLVHLHQTVADHVGEDKVQIVTFRDRNRME